MGIKTLKTGTQVNIKGTDQTGTITTIQDGMYWVDNSPAWYTGSELTPVKQKAQLKKTAGPNKKSEKKTALDAIYAIIRPMWLQYNKLCRARYAGCTHKASEIHHMNGRKGFWLIISKWFFPICRNCHRTVTKNSADAISRGISLADHHNPEYEFNSLERKLMEKYGVNPPI